MLDPGVFRLVSCFRNESFPSLGIISSGGGVKCLRIIQARSSAMKETIRFRLNGKPTSIETDGDRSLLWVLRTDLGLTGTKFGCGESLCGACTVVVDRNAVRSCRLPVRDVRSKDVTTIEGLGREGKLHPLQQAFVDEGALQCGFCTPGMIMTAYALLLKKPAVTREEIVAAMDDNLCRCGAHVRILDAIQEAAVAPRGGAR